MYSYEIQKILETNGYIISPGTYTEICDTSPQINHIKYNPYSNSFIMEADGYCWDFTVK